MIKVIKINKVGNRISSYTCTDGNTTIDISKDQLIKYIDAKQAENATKQIYKGTIIIRVKEADTNTAGNASTVRVADNVNNNAKESRASKVLKVKPLVIDVGFIDKLYVINSTAHLKFKANLNGRAESVKYKAKLIGLGVHEINGAIVVNDAKDNVITVYYDGKLILGEAKFKRRNRYFGVNGQTDEGYKLWPIVLDENGLAESDEIVGNYIASEGTVRGVFSATKFKSIDISELDWSSTRYLSLLFDRCKAERIVLCNTVPSSAIDASGMFKRCNLDELDISTLKMDNIKSAFGIFRWASIKKLNLGDFNINNINPAKTIHMFDTSVDFEEIHGNNIKINIDERTIKYIDEIVGSTVNRTFGGKRCVNITDKPDLYATPLDEVMEELEQRMDIGADTEFIGCDDLKRVYIIGRNKIIRDEIQRARRTVVELEIRRRIGEERRIERDRRLEIERQKKAELDRVDPYIEIKLKHNGGGSPISGGARTSEILKISGSDLMHKLIHNICKQLLTGIWSGAEKGINKGSAAKYDENRHVTYVSPNVFDSEKQAREYYANKLKECIKQEFKDKGMDPISNWSRKNQFKSEYLDATVYQIYQAYDELKGRKKRE